MDAWRFEKSSKKAGKFKVPAASEVNIFVDKISFKGTIISVQPRIRLIRSFDERSHNYLGYALLIRGIIDDVEREFSIGIGKAAQQTHQFCAGDEISGECVPVVDGNLESVEFYKVSKLKKIDHTSNKTAAPPPWETVPPDLEIYILFKNIAI